MLARFLVYLPMLLPERYAVVKLTPSRKAKLILFKILEFAEIGGMAPEDCGVAYEAVSQCLDEVCVKSHDEIVMEGLVDQIQQILRAEEWEQ
jgi:hypothetical protein